MDRVRARAREQGREVTGAEGVADLPLNPDARPLEPASWRHLIRPSRQKYLLIGRHLDHNSPLPPRGTTSQHAAHKSNSVVAPHPKLELGSVLRSIAQLQRATPHVVRI